MLIEDTLPGKEESFLKYSNEKSPIVLVGRTSTTPKVCMKVDFDKVYDSMS